MALLFRQGEVSRWLTGRGVDLAAVEAAFPGCGWPLGPPLSWPSEPPDPSDAGTVIAVDPDSEQLGQLGSRQTDGRLLCAIVLRGGGVGEWLAREGIDVGSVETAFPGSGWG
jgi:hypothetical protein